MKRGTSESFLGSYSFVGESEEATIDAAADRTGGTPLWRALSDAGLGDQKRAPIEKDRSIDFLEAHIEQGGRPESKELSIGIVTSIVSISQFKITFEDTQNRAGPTRAGIRRDAGGPPLNFFTNCKMSLPDIRANVRFGQPDGSLWSQELRVSLLGVPTFCFSFAMTILRNLRS